MLSREGLILGCYLSVGICSLETWSIDKGAVLVEGKGTLR